MKCILKIYSMKYTSILINGIKMRIEECFSDIQDSCWAGFDAMHIIVVYNGQLDNFLNGFTEITKEEFDKKVNDVCVNMKKWINYWIES